MRVGFLGPAGTFTEEALRASAPGPVEEVPYATVHEAIMAVQDGHADRAVVPIENSLEGSVTATLDALAADAADVRIVLEVVRPITHCLIGRAGTGLDEVRRVVSHPQAIAQCEGFLRARLPAAEVTPATSTAEAVRTVADSTEPWAALGSRLAAELYGAPVLAEGVEDRPGNETRFVWLAPAAAAAAAPEATKTSIVFLGPGDRTPGALVGVLRELSGRAINLTKIESRPRRLGLGHYLFFLDLDGGEHDPPVAAALEALAGRVESLRVLGSYPSA
ncbi:MAG: prephenate dehydratase [Thermoleophilaceae bacterium]